MMYRDDPDPEAPAAAASSEAEPAAANSIDTRHEISYSDELKRKSVHLVALVIPVAMWLAGRSLALVLLLGTAGLALTADFLRVRLKWFADGIYRFFGFMMRPEECPPVGGRLVLNGATWVLLSATMLVAVFPLETAIVAFTVFMIADAAAAIVGRRWGRRRWGHTTRTAEGSAAFFVVGFAIMALFGWMPLWVTLATVFAGAAAEIPSRPFNDNVRVPLVMAAIITLCGTIAQ